MSEWRQLVESLYRLYGESKVSKAKIVDMHKEKKITSDEMTYILSAQPQ